ncbi:MAG: type I DNA topoisomerase [Actinomycetota bacterium]
MPKTLVVVESPTKAKTLERYLGSDYTVRASYGHIRDLPKSKLGVDPDHGFEPEYVVPENSEKAVRELRAAQKRADAVVLATDYDREGEAIAFHVAELLQLPIDATQRVTFTEITKDAILDAFRHPRTVDLRLVEAQQARRILDRLVGYRISPILWRKVRPGLSAGRVQSVAVRLIVERERAIRAFTPVEYWSVEVRLTPEGAPDEQAPFLAKLIEIPGGKLAASPDKKGIHLADVTAAQTHVDRLQDAAYRVREVRESERKRSPSPPFTTSTLQQEAARKLGFSTRQTMRLAQQLYEGINLPGEGQVGLISYHRTDSVTIAETALREIAELVKNDYGDAYTLGEPRRYKKKQRGAQEAHEAIRPTSVLRTPQRVSSALDANQMKLYRLIWQRTVASQMAEARFKQLSVDIEATATTDGSVYVLRATGQQLLFDGFRRVYFEGRDDAVDEDAEAMLPALTAEQLLRMLEVLPEQHFTQPPPRFTEASLVKTLEEQGIGRPSTYASTLSTIRDREYVRLEDRRFFPEDVGEVVTDLLVEFFPDIVDVRFTAKMEDELDDIAEGKLGWTQVLDEFYGPFERLLEKNEDEIKRFEQQLDEKCPKCPTEGREPGNLIVKLGRYGKFIGCDKYPDCSYIRNMDGTERPEPEMLDETCPECGKQLTKKVGRFGPFVGCSGYPDCRYIKREEVPGTGVTCPQCSEGEIVPKRARGNRTFYSCSRYPDCTFAASYPPVPDRPCPECASVMLEQAPTKGGARCWNCGCVVDDEGTVVESGDPEAEAERRAAKDAARAKRAEAKAAKNKSTKKSTKKKTTAKKKATKKKTTAKRKATAKQKTTTAETTVAGGNGATSSAGPAEADESVPIEAGSEAADKVPATRPGA